MLAISPNTKAFICSQFIDFRKGIDGLQGVCRKIIRQDPFSGTIFIEENNGAGMQIRSCDLQALIWNGHPGKANFSKDWREIS